MTCYCDYDSSPSMYSEVWHKAKKEHKCCECGQTIKPGQSYQRVSGVWEGDFSSYKTCERCADLREALAEVSCPTYRGLSEEYFNYLDSWLPAEQRDETYRRVFPVVPNAEVRGDATKAQRPSERSEAVLTAGLGILFNGEQNGKTSDDKRRDN